MLERRAMEPKDELLDESPQDSTEELTQEDAENITGGKIVPWD
jgi:hypothetical protein